MKSIFKIAFLLVIGLVFVYAEPILADYIPIDEGLIAVTYHVDPSHPSASDSNPGTATLPLLTISKGIEKGY